MPDWKETKAAYRFFTQLQGGGEPIQRAHWERTRAQCQQPGEYLLIEDTSELDYTGHLECEGLGSIGNGGGRGLLLHSALALRVEAWDLEQRPEAVVVGLAWQKCWSRAGQLPRRKQPWRQRMSRPRESQRWAQGFKQWGRPAAGCQWVWIADREADFYDPIHLCQQQGIDFIVRAYRDRRLADSPEHLMRAVAQMPVRGTMRLELRARPGQAARTAVVQVRAGTVALHGPERPGGKLEDFTLEVVEVRELGAPAGVEPLHWLLLTSRPCQKWVQVQRIVSCYASRWWIEEYHKALKSGVGVEASQMQQAYRIESLVAVLAMVAVRLVAAKWLARTRPDEPVDQAAIHPGALKILNEKYGGPKGGWTHRSLWVAVARLGGFLARKGDGQPGWQTIWRGWQRLQWMCEGIEILAQP